MSKSETTISKPAARAYRGMGGIAQLGGRLRGTANLSLLTSASSLIGTTAVTSILGFAYWWLAARQFPAQVVGLASASISAMLLLGTLGALGFGTLLIRELPRRRDQAFPFVLATLTVTGGAGAILGGVFACIVPLLSDEFAPLAASPGAVILFAAGVGLTSATIVLDQALLGILRGGKQFWRNTLFSATKLLALATIGFWSSERQALAIYATWIIGNALSLAWVAFGTLSARRGWRSYVPRVRVLWSFRRAALGHHLLNLALQGTSFATPLIVTALVSATANAYFYAAWMLAGFVYAGPMALAVSLYAAGSNAPEALAQRMRFTFALALLGGVAANVVLFVATDPLLRLFGANYATSAGTALQLLGLGVFPIIIKDNYVTLRRIEGTVRGAAGLVAIGGVLELGCAAIGALLGGVQGVALGLLIGLCLEALLFIPTLYRVLRPQPQDATTAVGPLAR